MITEPAPDQVIKGSPPSAAARRSPIFDIPTLPSRAAGELFLREAEAMPGERSRDSVIAAPSRMGAGVPPVSSRRERARMRALVLGSRFTVVVKSALPPPSSRPSMRAEQEAKRTSRTAARAPRGAPGNAGTGAGGAANGGMKRDFIAKSIHLFATFFHVSCRKGISVKFRQRGVI
jgi:hypothetical protein